jgi:hypothetical protein
MAIQKYRLDPATKSPGLMLDKTRKHKYITIGRKVLQSLPSILNNMKATTKPHSTPLHQMIELVKEISPVQGSRTQFIYLSRKACRDTNLTPTIFSNSSSIERII